MQEKVIHVNWVRGHNGNQYNEECDEMALWAANNPTKEDVEYKEQRPASGKTSSTAAARGQAQGQTRTGTDSAGGDTKPWDSVPAPGGAEYYTGPGRNVKDACKASIKRLNQKQTPGFKDFVSLRTGGQDGWSTFRDITSMVDQGTADKLEEVLGSKAEVATCLRWYGRGLKFRHCIRKVLVDAEVRKNAAKSRYR